MAEKAAVQVKHKMFRAVGLISKILEEDLDSPAERARAVEILKIEYGGQTIVFGSPFRNLNGPDSLGRETPSTPSRSNVSPAESKESAPNDAPDLFGQDSSSEEF